MSAAIWFLVFTTHREPAVIPMHSKAACYAVVQNMTRKRSYYVSVRMCVNAETGEVVLAEDIK